MIGPEGPALWLFDCDGVLLDSNAVKTAVFREIAAPYGDAAADELDHYHRTYGGVSRYVKWRYFFETILGRTDAEVEAEIAQAIERFGVRCREAVEAATVDPAAEVLLRQITDAGGRSYVISGTDQVELRAILEAHGLSHHFAGIFGSPRNKSEIFRDLLPTEPELRANAVMIGDSTVDIDTAHDYGIDAIFVSHWTEVDDWQAQMTERGAPVVHSLADLLTTASV